MTTTFKVGAGSSGGAYIKYLLSKAVEVEHNLDAAARYYASRGAEQQQIEPVPLEQDQTLEVAQAIARGDLTTVDGIDIIVEREMGGIPDPTFEQQAPHMAWERDHWVYTRDLDQEREEKRFDIEGRVEARLDVLVEQITAGALSELVRAETLADLPSVALGAAAAAPSEAGIPLSGGGAVLRPDIDPDFAKRLEIDTSRPLTVREITHLLDNRTALGNGIEGKKKHSAHRSVAQTFGLDEKQLPTVEAVRNVLDGRRADGSQPVDERGRAIPEHVIESSIRKFKSAMGVPATRDTTDAEIQNVADGRFNGADYLRQINATAPPVGYVDIVWSADKSVSSAWSLSPTEAEADIVRSWVREASAAQMAYLETKIAVARSGAGGLGPTEPAKMAWVSTEHVDARPTVDIVRRDAQGQEFTDTADVPVTRFDPQLHVHNPTFSSILTETGRVSSLNLNLLEGEVKVAGAIGHAQLATLARKHGVRVSLGPSGEARLDDVPEWLRKFHSRRTIEGTEKAKEYAAAQDKDWEKLTPEQQSKCWTGALPRNGATRMLRKSALPRSTDPTGSMKPRRQAITIAQCCDRMRSRRS